MQNSMRYLFHQQEDIFAFENMHYSPVYIPPWRNLSLKPRTEVRIISDLYNSVSICYATMFGDHQSDVGPWEISKF
jgi:hypothetical protein